MLERERELTRIRDVLGEAAAGHGRLLVIEGPAGIGKSTLLNEARALAGDAGMDVLHARGSELERSYPFGLVSSLFEARFSRAPELERQRWLQGRAALAAPLLAPVEGDIQPASPTDEFALVHGLYWGVVNLAEHQPVALLVDDVHWADELSLRFLIYLAQRVEDLPVALLVAIRSGDPAATSELVARLSTTTSEQALRPAELSQDAVRDLLAAADITVADREEFVRASWKATRGNPFLLNELVAAIRHDPAAQLGIHAGDVGAFAPQSVARTVVVRLTRLGADALALARACALLGDETPLTSAAKLAGLDPAAAGAAAGRLSAAQIFAAGELLSFAHPMIRSAVYSELPPGEGTRMHLAAARLLDDRGAAAAEVAHHLVAGTPCDEPWALGALHDAARNAARKGSPDTAVRYLRRALELDPHAERAGAMLVDLGMAEAATGETTSLERFETALAMIDDPPERARAMYALGQTLYRYGRHADAAETFGRGATLFAQDRDLALMFEGAVMCCAIQVGSIHAEAMRRLESLVSEIPPGGPATAAERTLLSVHSLNRSLSVPPAEEAAELARAALGAGELLREQTSESMAVNLAIMALVCCGCLEEAQLAVDEVLADARARGAVLAFAEGSMVRAMAMLPRGRIDEAMADAQAAMGGMERGWHALVPIPQAIAAQCFVEKGDLDSAEAVLRDVEPHLPDVEARGIRATYVCARGLVRLARGDPEAALSDLLDVATMLETYGVINPNPVAWRVPAAVAALATGDRDRALGLVEEEIAVARDFGLTAPLGAALRVRAVFRGHDVAELEEAVEVLEGADAPLELARALFDLGGALRRAGRRVACREPLRRALDLAHQCGATALEQRVLDELHASGARPRRAMMTGVEALTPSERRIADLVAAGHTNREVAETLFLTKGTVEWHLKRVYQKLDVRSREALTALLEQERAQAATS